ncbi:MAG: endonuclease/exonuclease/phosphatase family protein [Chloroflexi bacterium]|nr:endonuclease/exonuclease/phosphatase family protein [Chloroflexota bacterium]
MSLVKVMSFNIRYGTADDGEHRWENRKEMVIRRIQSFDPDLVGLQECRDDAQAAYVKNSLPNYEFIGVRRGGNSETTLEMTPILYKKTVFAEIARGNFWLSETPDVPGSKGWGSLFPRTVTWTKLQCKNSTHSVVFLNAHFDHRSVTAQEQSAALVCKWAQQFAAQHAVIVTGDFNTGKDTLAYECLVNGDVLYDVYRKAHAGRNQEETYHGYGKPGAQAAIDWLLASHQFETIAAEIDRFCERGLYPSDHFPLTAVLQFCK